MKKVNHVNLMDSENRVFCRLLNKVVVLNEAHQRDFCSGCDMYQGSAQGEGVECSWDDIRNVANPLIVTNPELERDNILTSEAKDSKE